MNVKYSVTVEPPIVVRHKDLLIVNIIFLQTVKIHITLLRRLESVTATFVLSCNKTRYYIHILCYHFILLLRHTSTQAAYSFL